MTELQSPSLMPYSFNQQSNRLSHLGKKAVLGSNGAGGLGVLEKRLESLEEELEERKK